jgi:hypothetical protein
MGNWDIIDLDIGNKQLTQDVTTIVETMGLSNSQRHIGLI